MKATLGRFRLTHMERLILQHKAANQSDDPYKSPVFQLKVLLGE